MVEFLSLRAATQELEPKLSEACARVLASGHYIGGPEVEGFEKAFAAYVGAKHCIGVGNGLDAIVLALEAHGIGPGDEVLVPSNTFIATWLGVSRVGARPVPVHPDWRTHLVTADAFRAAVTPKTKAIIPVQLYGAPVDMEPMKALARERSLVLIDDAAQAQGASVRGTRIGGFGTTTTWSFYPGKNLGALGDAGAITTDDDAIAGTLRKLRNYGSTVKYVHELAGHNSRLDPLQAAMLSVKLERLDEWNQRRARIASRYLESLAGLEGLELPSVPAGHLSAWHLFVVRSSRRDALQAHLKSQGIDTLIHYPLPPHLQGAYREQGYDVKALAPAEVAANEVLSLPIGPHLSADDARSVIDGVRGFHRL